MDFSAWSPSHLIVALLAFATIIGQAIAVLARLKTITERLEDRLDRLEDWLDKRFIEVISQVNEQVALVRTEVRDVRSEMDQQITGVREEIHDLRLETSQRLSDVQSEMSKLNQNHIDHLHRHHD